MAIQIISKIPSRPSHQSWFFLILPSGLMTTHRLESSTATQKPEFSCQCPPFWIWILPIRCLVPKAALLTEMKSEEVAFIKALVSLRLCQKKQKNCPHKPSLFMSETPVFYSLEGSYCFHLGIWGQPYLHVLVRWGCDLLRNLRWLRTTAPTSLSQPDLLTLTPDPTSWNPTSLFQPDFMISPLQHQLWFQALIPQLHGGPQPGGKGMT